MLAVVGLVALRAKPSTRLLTLICLIAVAGAAAQWLYPHGVIYPAWRQVLASG